MAPIKLEDNIKNRMEERRLTPSENSWHLLAQRLEEQTPEKKTNYFFWFGIAATLVGFVLITVLWFQSSDVNNLSPTIVNTPVEEIIKEPANNSIKPQIEHVEMKQNNAIVVKDNNTESDRELTPDRNKNKKEAHSRKNNTAVADVKITKPLIKIEKSTFAQNLEVNTLVVENEEGTHNNNLSLDDEVENLLKSAQEDVFRSKALTQNKSTITAEELLNDVEFEIEDSFRTKVFEVVKSGFKTVKTAVAERNN